MKRKHTARVVLGLVAGGALIFGLYLVTAGTMRLWLPAAALEEAARLAYWGMALVLVAGAALLWLIWGERISVKIEHDWLPNILIALTQWNDGDEAISSGRRSINLVLVSAAGLFFELVFIRYLGGEIKVFAFLKNVVLIASFLGFGLGFFLARRRPGLLPLFLPAAALLLATVALGSASGLLRYTVIPRADELVLVGLGLVSLEAIPVILRVVTWIPFYVITLLYFLCTVLIFIPLGQYTGKCMRGFVPIRAYSLNLVGALAGTLTFVAVSFLWQPPIVWFMVAALMLLPLLWRSTAWLRAVNLIAVAALLLIHGVPDRLTIWSPYNKLSAAPAFLTDSEGQSFAWGYNLSVGEYYYQSLADFSADFFRAHPDAGPELRYSEYEVPYSFAQPESALILGAGTGNDVAAALRHGVKQVDAVDIDPAIIEFGRRLHPERPYESAAVSTHANDARAFLRQSGRDYDLVLFGLLDSQQVLSAFGSVRLDNFVYTVEGMRSAFSRVAPGGLLVITFDLFQPWMGDRIAGILEAATGQIPVVLDAPHGTAFVIRNGAPITGAEVVAARGRLAGQARARGVDPAAEILTQDDWPYLYLRHRSLPFAYWTMLPLLALVGVALSRRILGRGWTLHWRFFWLGAAFMLMEVRIIAQSALIFGSTWLVSAAAITVVLVMAILANLLVSRMPRTTVLPWAILLLVTLAISSLVPSATFLGLGQLGGGLLAALTLALPLFFAGMVFSTSLRQAMNVDTAMASNLLGAILGGFIEYFSLLLGIGSLAWLAAVIYVLALLARAEAWAGEPAVVRAAE